MVIRPKIGQKVIDLISGHYSITPPKKVKADYFDTEMPGLMLRVMPTGTKTYSCRYRDTRGKQGERSLGSARVLKLSEARQCVRDIRAKLAMGEDPFEMRRTLKAVPTFAAFVETAYMPHIKGYKRSWSTDECLLRNHILPKLGNLYLDEIKRQHLSRCSVSTARPINPPAPIG